jgi:hypothetical protein
MSNKSAAHHAAWQLRESNDPISLATKMWPQQTPAESFPRLEVIHGNIADDLANFL